MVLTHSENARLEHRNARHRIGWSPYENETLKGVVTDVFVNGQRVVKDSVQASMKPFGQRLVFEK